MSISWTAFVVAGAAAGITQTPEIIIVRGKLETARDVPASAITVSPSGILSVDDIANAVPGVWMINDQDPGTNILSIRGATTDRLQQASIAFVMDGLPLADTELFTSRLFDVAKIDVLKGPQGVLYGKNAAGGVIAVFNQAARVGGATNPDAFIQTRIGNGGVAELEFGKSYAVSDVLTVRAAGVWASAQGWIDNTTLNKKVDGSETKAMRIATMGRALGFDLDVRFMWLAEEGGAAWASSNNVTGKNQGRLKGAVLINPIGDFEGRASRRWVRSSATAQRVFSSGRLDLLIARDSYQKRWTEELDYRPGPLTFFGLPAFPDGIQPIAQPIDVRATTLQARWTSELRGPLNFQIGAFAQNTEKDRVDDFGPLLFGSLPLAYVTRSRQLALFGGVEWRASERWRVEAQGRIDQDKRKQSISASKSGVQIETRQGVFERFQPRIAASYRFGPNIRAYASYAAAFRPGGFNPRPGDASIWTATYRPEVTVSYEIGAKLDSLPLEGRIDGAVFSNRVKDFQFYSFIDNQSVTLNVDEVLVTGFEASASFTPLPQVRLGASYALAPGKIKSFRSTDPLLGSPATRDYSGKTLPNAPRDTAKIWGVFSSAFKETRVEVRLDANHAGTTFYEIDNVLRSPPRWWADVTLNADASVWTVSLKAENVTDERWAISAFGQGTTGLLAGLGPGGPFDTFTINRGRKISVGLRREF